MIPFYVTLFCVHNIPKSPSSCLIKVVLYINVGVEQILSVRGQIHLVEDQVFKGLLQVGLSNQHRPYHPATAENNLEREYRGNV